MEYCDVLVVGGGPGGLAAAKAARECGLQRVVVLERNLHVGGILNQCVHDGFGLIRYRKQLTGTEYAAYAQKETLDAGAEIWPGNLAVDITSERIVTSISREGIKKVQAGVIILATGCRERTRGAISIPGTRPAGIFTAGVAQELINVHNIIVGKQIVIIGSGDIGLIMARRLTLEGAKVKAVIEVMSQPSGLARNIQQCLYDFDIPLHISHTVTNIYGEKRIEGVEISSVDEKMRPISGTEHRIDCDTLILSVGLIPENEIARTAGIKLDRNTNGVLTDRFLQTNIRGVFSCGNSRRVMDLADFVSKQGELAGKNAAHYLRGEPMDEWDESCGTSMIKGFPKAGSVTCTLCPNGCQILWDDAMQKCIGNSCSRGARFLEEERTTPKRVLTTTMRVAGGNKPLLSVRSAGSVNKRDLIKLSEEIRARYVKAPVKIGQIVCELPNGVQMIATESSRSANQTM